MHDMNKIGCLYVSLPFLIMMILAICFAPFLDKKNVTITPKEDYHSPLGANCHTPLALSETFQEADATDSLSWMQLKEASNSVGIYELRLDYPKLADGMLSIKCYDDTENTALRLQLQPGFDSSVKQHSKFGKLINTRLTIIESSSRDNHVARFEVWYKPATSSVRRLLIEKKFLVCGQTEERN